MQILDIELEPRPFQRPRFNRGRGFNDPKYDQFKQKLKYFLICKSPKCHEKNVGVKIVFSMPMPKKKPKWPYPSLCDIDNLIKAVFDAGNGILWSDDRHIVKVEATKQYDYVPGIYIEVRELCHTE